MVKTSLTARSETADQLATEARAWVEGAELLVSADDHEAALDYYRKGLAVYETLAAADPGDTKWQQNLVTCRQRIGRSLAASGDREGALAEYRAASAISKRLAADNPGNANWRRDLAASHDEIGNILDAGGDRMGALAEYRAAAAIRKRLAADDLGNTEWLHLTNSHDKIGDALAAGGDRMGALAEYRAASAIRKERIIAEPRNDFWWGALVDGQEKIGDMLAADGDRMRALAEYRAAFAIREKLAAEVLGNAFWWRVRRGHLASSHDKIGDLLAAGGDREGALAEHRAAFAIREELVALDPGNAEWQHDLSVSRAKLAALRKRGARQGRQNSDLVSHETMYDNPVPGETTTPAQARGKPGLRHRPPLPKAGHELTRPAATQPQSVSAEASILLGDLPESLRPRGYVKRNAPPSREEIRAADSVLRRYRTLKAQGHNFTEPEINAMRAAERVKYSVKKFAKLGRE